MILFARKKIFFEINSNNNENEIIFRLLFYLFYLNKKCIYIVILYKCVNIKLQNKMKELHVLFLI